MCSCRRLGTSSYRRGWRSWELEDSCPDQLIELIKRKNNYLWTVTVGQHKVNTLSLFISQRDCGDKSAPVPHAKYWDVEVLSTFVFIDTSLSIVF